MDIRLEEIKYEYFLTLHVVWAVMPCFYYANKNVKITLTLIVRWYNLRACKNPILGVIANKLLRKWRN